MNNLAPLLMSMVVFVSQSAFSAPSDEAKAALKEARNYQWQRHYELKETETMDGEVNDRHIEYNPNGKQLTIHQFLKDQKPDPDGQKDFQKSFFEPEEQTIEPDLSRITLVDTEGELERYEVAIKWLDKGKSNPKIGRKFKVMLYYHPKTDRFVRFDVGLLESFRMKMVAKIMQMDSKEIFGWESGRYQLTEASYRAQVSVMGVDMMIKSNQSVTYLDRP